MILFVPLAYQIQPGLQAVLMFKVAAGAGTTNSFKAMAVCPLEFQSTAGLTMRVGRVRATRTQTATVTKISTDTKLSRSMAGTHLVSGISVLHMYCSTRGARFIPLTELEKYCL